jgi:5-methylcytosine-specific restriction endonuclease McrA
MSEVDPSHFDETSPIHGLRYGEFSSLSSDVKVLLLRMIARCCEKSYRRGFMQGWDSRDRGDKVCDLHKWRFSTGLGIAVSPHDTYHETSLQRLKMECHLYQVGLPKIEESFMSASDISSHIAPLFARHRIKNGIRKSVRFAVLSRDGFRCVYCGASARETELHVDHVHPKSLGGNDEMENLVAACQSCNLGKSNKQLVAPSEVTHGR